MNRLRNYGFEKSFTDGKQFSSDIGYVKIFLLAQGPNVPLSEAGAHC